MIPDPEPTTKRRSDERQTELFGEPHNPKPAAWTDPDSFDHDKVSKKPWAQRRDEFMQYHDANPKVLGILVDLSHKAELARYRGDAQRLYTDFKGQYVDEGRYPNFPREYITFYVRLVMYKDETLRGYYKLKRQDGEPDAQWNRWKDWYDNRRRMGR